MRAGCKGRWLSKTQIESLRKSGALGHSIVVNSFKGFILVEPVHSHLGRGRVVTRDFAQFGLDPTWCNDPPRTIGKARQLLGLQCT